MRPDARFIRCQTLLALRPLVWLTPPTVATFFSAEAITTETEIVTVNYYCLRGRCPLFIPPPDLGLRYECGYFLDRGTYVLPQGQTFVA